MKETVENKPTTVDYMLRTTWNAVVKYYNTKARQIDLTMGMGFTLLSINPITGSPSTSLGPRMGMEPTSLSRTLKTLEDKNLIGRAKNPRDGRGVIITLTDEGRALRNNVEAAVYEFNSLVKEKFTSEKLKHFYEVTSGIQDIIVDDRKFNN